MNKPQPSVKLKPYSEDDFPVLKRNNAPDMTAYLGGPESDEKLLDRHQRYVKLKAGEAYMYVIWVDNQPVGTIGYWEKEWQGATVWEAGWGVFPAYQGRGIAFAALNALTEKAQQEGKYRYLHAYPKIENGASNALCRKAGFELMGECDFEYPAGHPIRCNDWRLDLQAKRSD